VHGEEHPSREPDDALFIEALPAVRRTGACVLFQSDRNRAALAGMITPSDLSVSIGLVSEKADVAALWRELEARTDASFFLSWDWIGCWLRESAVSPYLIIARHEDRIVAMALLQPSRRSRHHFLNTNALMLHQVGDPDTDIITIEHNGILIDRDFTSVAMRACVDFLIRNRQAAGGMKWDELHLDGLPSPEGLRPLADQAGLMMWYHSYKQSWAVDLNSIRQSGGSYLDSLSANTRYQIRRSIRLYEQRGALSTTPARGVEEAMLYFDHMKQLHQRYWESRGLPGSFAYPFFERFHRALITDCLPKGTVELVLIAAGGEPLGYVYNFVRDGWVCAYHTGFRYEEDPRLKPGLVSHHLCIARHLQQGARLYDFLAGNERYKASLATPGPDIGYLVLQRPLLKLRAEKMARQLKNNHLPRLFATSQAPAAEQRGRDPVNFPEGVRSYSTWAEAGPRPGRNLAWTGEGTAGDPRVRGNGRLSGKQGMRRGKVLILGDDTRSFLAIARSLGRRQIEVHVAPANFASVALKSRYIARIHYLPYWMADGTEWLQAMEELLRAEHFDLVIPCNETTLLPIQRNRTRLRQFARLAIPDDDSIDVLFDKHNTRELARSLGINVSAGRLPRPDDTADTVLSEMGTPVVVKPRKSYSVDELQLRAKVLIIHDAAELRPLLPLLEPAHFVYETFFPGRGAGVSVLASRGKVLQAFEHHRQRESGSSGSFYRVSAQITPALERCCTSIVAALAYTGIAMFEFRLGGFDSTDDSGWVLLEVNARPWGSLPLPVGLGVDFPYRWYTLLVDGEETPSVSYRTGIFGRNLIPDLWSILADAKQIRDRGGSLLGFTLSMASELGRVFTTREIHDVLVRDDPAPGLLELSSIVSELASRLGRRLPFVADLRRLSARTSLKTALRNAAGGEVRVIFVCQGNICRSPFAEALLRTRLVAKAVSVAVASFGMLPRPGRPTPDLGIAAAEAKGIDLRAHRSTHLSRAEAEVATVIFVFDEINRRAILERYPGLRVPILRLGDFAPKPIGNIDDPIDGDRALYDETYDAIETSIIAIAGLLNAHGKPTPIVTSPDHDSNL
jgi:protein-tyrosine-phosphatase/predicted ATP-grasp superfamily ATP-dependent carboligase/CelD/BcsL family acetyltransferase involved in cellulose biosynthesis